MDSASSTPARDPHASPTEASREPQGFDTTLPPEAEAELQALIAAQEARRDEEAATARATHTLWLSHHWPDEYERCAVIGRRHVCRRCLVLYPLAIAAMIASLAGFQPWPERLDAWFIWLLCIPATLDFLAEKLRDVPYDPRRQVVVTALTAVALGRGLAHELDDRWSWLFWGPVLVYGGIWFAAAVVKMQRTMFAEALEQSISQREAEHGAELGDAPGTPAGQDRDL